MSPVKYHEEEILSHFQPITLAEMDEVKLMNRTDTKFVLKRSFFNEILPELAQSYKALEIAGKRLASYRTLYYDTQSFQLFLDHHNGRGNRFKIRIRNYVESNLYFLEIKNKFKGRTDKRRTKVKDFELDLSPESVKFINKVVGHELNLVPKLWNSFQRITLVNTKEIERLTLDLNLTFEWDNTKRAFEHVVIAELKQENVNRNSLFYSLMKRYGVRPNSMSKYCVGGATLNPELKSNNFKDKFLLIDKLQEK
ncbi:MAG: polyphosphate polymerase domain-containing protein [Crocinitomicaceae bacterium]|nr:polyphosphate polymerase domain-containing protein [Crocinitomicaceae bacterium]